jgi:hypothetical protein
MLPVGIEPAIPASERPQTHALDRAVTWVGGCDISWYEIRTRSLRLSSYGRPPPQPRDSIIGGSPIIIGESAPRALRRQTAFRRTEFSLKNATVDFNNLHVWGLPSTTWCPHRVVYGSLILSPLHFNKNTK